MNLQRYKKHYDDHISNIDSNVKINRSNGVKKVTKQNTKINNNVLNKVITIPKNNDLPLNLNQGLKSNGLFNSRTRIPISITLNINNSSQTITGLGSKSVSVIDINNNFLTDDNNTFVIFNNGILPYSYIRGYDVTITYSNQNFIQTESNEAGGTNYYIKLNIATLTPNLTIGIYIARIGDITSTINGGQSIGYLTPNDMVYIVNTDFPYPVNAWDNTDADITFDTCTFNNTVYRTATDAPYPPILGQISSQQEYLLNLNKTVNTTVGNYYFSGNNVFNVPAISNISFIPISVSGASSISNSGQFYINIDYTEPGADIDVELFQIDSYTYSDTTDPILQLTGAGNLSIDNPVNTGLTIRNLGSDVVNIQNSNFSRGVILDCTYGSGIISFDYCKIFSPQIISGNVYCVTTIGNNTQVDFANRQSIIWTNVILSHPWQSYVTTGDVVDSTDTEFLGSLVTPTSGSNLSVVLNQGQNYTFSTTPYNLHSANLVLNDSVHTYSLVDLKNKPFISALTDTSYEVRRAKMDKGYERAFSKKIPSISPSPRITISNIESIGGVGIYSSNANITVGSFTLDSGDGLNQFLFSTLGNSNINVSGSNYVMNLRNGKNFWNNLAGSNLKLNGATFTYNLYSNINTYNFTTEAGEYEGVNSIYDIGVNLCDFGANVFSLITDNNLTVNPLANSVIINDSTIENGITINDMNEPKTVHFESTTINNDNQPFTFPDSTTGHESLITILGSNTTVDILDDNNFNILYDQFVTSNVRSVTTLSCSTTDYNLLGEHCSEVIFSEAIDDNYNRKLEKEQGVTLVTCNGIYNLANITNDIYGADVPFKIYGEEPWRAKLVHTHFPNEVVIKQNCEELIFCDCTLTRQGTLCEQPATLDLHHTHGLVKLINSTLTANNGSNFIRNWQSAATACNYPEVCNTEFVLKPSCHHYKLNSEPDFVNEVTLDGCGEYLINYSGCHLERNMTYNASEHQKLTVYADYMQYVNSINGRIKLTGYIQGNVDDSYALELYGGGNVEVKHCDSLTLSHTNQYADLIHIYGQIQSLKAHNITMSGSYRIPIYSELDCGYGNIDIGCTNFDGAIYPYVYWPRLYHTELERPFKSHNKYLAMSWLPNYAQDDGDKNIIAYEFTKNQDDYGYYTFNNSTIVNDFPPHYCVENSKTKFKFDIALGCGNDLSGALYFSSLSPLLDGIYDSDIVNNEINQSIISKGVVGYLNCHNKEFSDTGYKYHYNFSVDNDSCHNYYVGQLEANIRLSSNDNIDLPDFKYTLYEYQDENNDQFTFSLDLVSNGCHNKVSDIPLDVYNDTSNEFKYEVTTNNNRPVILNGYVYMTNEDGSVIVPDYKASYANGTDGQGGISYTLDGIVLSGSIASNINVSNIVGIAPNEPWTVDCRFKLNGNLNYFKVFETNTYEGYSNVVVWGNCVSSVCRVSANVDGETYLSGLQLTLDTDGYYHPVLSYAPYSLDDNNTDLLDRNNSGGYLYLINGPNNTNINDDWNNYTLPNVNVSTLTFGESLNGHIRDLRVSYINLDSSQINTIGVDTSNIKATIFYNSCILESPPGSGSISVLQDNEISIFSESLIGNVVVSNPGSSTQYYTYLRPQYYFSRTFNYGHILHQYDRRTYIKGDITDDNYWETININAALYFIENVTSNISIEPVASNVATITNTTPNYAFPLIDYGYYDNNNFYNQTTNIIHFYNSEDTYDFSNICVNSGDNGYTRDFIITVKMANLPDNGSGDIDLYSNTDNGIEFKFYELEFDSFTPYSGLPGKPYPGTYLSTGTNPIDSDYTKATISFTRTIQQGYINKNNIKSLYVKASCLSSSIPVGNLPEGGIIFEPKFNVENNLLSSLPFSRHRNTSGTTSSTGYFEFLIPIVISFSVSNYNGGWIGPYNSDFTSTKKLKQGDDTVYIQASTLAQTSNDVTISVSISRNDDLNILYSVLNKSISDSIISQSDNGTSFTFTISSGRSESDNLLQLQVPNNNLIWGNTSFNVSTTGLISGTENVDSYNSIIITVPYEEILTRGFYFWGTSENNYRCLEDFTHYYDNLRPSTEQMTSNFVIDYLNQKYHILSTEFRQGISMTTDSIPHYYDATEVNLKAKLSFKLANINDEEDTIDITCHVDVYDGIGHCAQKICNKTLVINTWNDASENEVFLDFSRLNFQDYDPVYRIVHVMACVKSQNGYCSPTDYNNEEVLAWKLNFENASIAQYQPADQFNIGNWRMITGSDGKLLLQFKYSSNDCHWRTVQCFSIDD